ncbi:hypothetical protein [Aquimarina aggregata]|uniref:hypothetical protein n=1 Tax=Aquimarina aggregata TaxID=1642818 RepID=UPI0024908075|nr:hypothetical protein [Aquimarina aggregata]
MKCYYGKVADTGQAIDLVPIKANAFMDSLELKVPKQDLSSHLKAVSDTNGNDAESCDKSNKENRNKELSDVKLVVVKSNKHKEDLSVIRKKRSTNANNKTYYSPTDPNAHISVKPGKAVKLNYHSQLSVDAAHHIIMDINAYHADKKDSQCLENIVERLHTRLWKFGFLCKDLLAETRYSSGLSIRIFREKGNTSLYFACWNIQRLVYNKEKYHYVYPNGEIIPFKKSFIHKHKNSQTLMKEYRSSSIQCKGCTLAEKCLCKSV